MEQVGRVEEKIVTVAQEEMQLSQILCVRWDLPMDLAGHHQSPREAEAEEDK